LRLKNIIETAQVPAPEKSYEEVDIGE